MLEEVTNLDDGIRRLRTHDDAEKPRYSSLPRLLAEFAKRATLAAGIMGVHAARRAGGGSNESSGANHSVTDLGDPALVRAPSLVIERGAVLAGRYQVEATIGQGGSGVVLRAFDRVAQVPVAIKILKPELATDPRWLERFSRELRLARQIQHPNVCRVFDIDQADGHWFITMELAANGTLRDAITDGPTRRPLADRIADVRAPVSGLAAIHAAGIVHRDVKPENYLRMQDGRLVLSDFGLATSPSEAPVMTLMVGTPSYMAPEVAMGEPANASSDVWSLGVVIHEMIFGRRPDWEIVRGRRSLRPQRLAESAPVGRAFAELCADCLDQDPARRPANGREVEGRLEAIAQGRRQRVWGRRASSSSWVWATAVVLLAGIVTLRGLWWRPVAASSSAIVRDGVVIPTGSPRDLSQSARVIGSTDEKVHCFTNSPDGRTARLILGSPRRAEDIDLVSGERKPSALDRSTFMLGCPQISPDGRALLFAASDDNGVVQVRLSTSPSGSPSRTITPGYEPQWLPNGREFLFNVDTAHAAVFSLPTASFTLIASGEGLDGGSVVADKAVSAKGDLIAILAVNDRAEPTIDVYSSPGLQLLRRNRMPSVRRLVFDAATNQLLVAYQRSSVVSTLVGLDWQGGKATHLASYPGFEVTGMGNDGPRRSVLFSRLDDDVWLYGDGTKRRLTTDGENVSASISRQGRLLIGKRNVDGLYSIWSYDQAGKGGQLTFGPADVSPDFASDGETWSYVDYARKSVMLCPSINGSCKVLRQDDMLPGWPRFSPDDRWLAYVTQAGTPHLVLVPVQGGAVRDLGPVLRGCSVVWSSPTTLWMHEGSARSSFWIESNIESGERTGNRIPYPVEVEPGTCWWPDAPGTPFFRRVRVERRELSRLVSGD